MSCFVTTSNNIPGMVQFERENESCCFPSEKSCLIMLIRDEFLLVCPSSSIARDIELKNGSISNIIISNENSESIVKKNNNVDDNEVEICIFYPEKKTIDIYII